MCDFRYNIKEPKNGENIQLFMTDTVLILKQKVLLTYEGYKTTLYHE